MRLWHYFLLTIMVEVKKRDLSSLSIFLDSLHSLFGFNTGQSTSILHPFTGHQCVLNCCLDFLVSWTVLGSADTYKMYHKSSEETDLP